MSDVHVVIGSGTIGARLARLLADGKKSVLLIARSTSNELLPGIERKSADASSVEALMAVAPSAKIVYNCVNPPYDKWAVEWPRISKAINTYSNKCGADLVVCSNLYGYGPHDGILTEDLPLNATWTNGRVRAEMWRQLKSLHDSGRLRATEVRGSDYLCANEQSRMGHRVIPNLLLGKKVQLLGELDQPHTWTDPDDVAHLMMTLAEEGGGWGRAWHVPSNEPRTQREVVADIASALAIEDYRVSAAGPLVEKMLGLFNPVIRELNAGSYQFNRPFVMSSKAAAERFSLQAKPWQRVIKDLVRPYLNYAKVHGEGALTKLGSQRLPE